MRGFKFYSICLIAAFGAGIVHGKGSLAYIDDMRLTKEQMLNIKLGQFIPGYGAKATRPWISPIPYTIDSSITQYKTGENLVLSSLGEIEQKTCIRFKKRTTETTYLLFIKGRSCSSGVGVHQGANRVSLTVWCWYKGATIHEIMHALGFFHEQCRHDREKYIRILWNNIPKNLWGNFKVMPIDSLGVPYDLDSVMHYGSREGGGGKEAIETLDPKDQYRIGQRKELSQMDILQLNLLYKCPGFTRPPPGYTTPKPRPPTTSKVVTQRVNTTPQTKTREPTKGITVGPAKNETICENRGKSISCPFPAYLEISSVFYGRENKITCSGQTSKTTNCSSSEANRIITAKCDGKRKCWLPVTRSLFPNDPCPGTSKYLTVSFVCVTRI